jgi:hypothetical protein
MRLQPEQEGRPGLVEQQSKRTETPDAPSVEYLLGVLRGLPQQDPSPELRDRLHLLSITRLREGAELVRQPGLRPWFRPAFVVALLIAIASVTMVVTDVRPPDPSQAGRIAPPKESFSAVTGASSSLPAAPVRPSKMSHPLSKLPPNTTARQMVLRLPYSDSAIDTGTDATIRVSMSQAELVSLGFPMNATLHDRRVVAELTLGDDGLPRAISVPLPVQIVKEKK